MGVIHPPDPQECDPLPHFLRPKIRPRTPFYFIIPFYCSIFGLCLLDLYGVALFWQILPFVFSAIAPVLWRLGRVITFHRSGKKAFITAAISDQLDSGAFCTWRRTKGFWITSVLLVQYSKVAQYYYYILNGGEYALLLEEPWGAVFPKGDRHLVFDRGHRVLCNVYWIFLRVLTLGDTAYGRHYVVSEPDGFSAKGFLIETLPDSPDPWGWFLTEIVERKKNGKLLL